MFAIGSCLDSGRWGAERRASWTGAKTERWAGTASLETQSKGCEGLCERERECGGRDLSQAWGSARGCNPVP